MTLQQKCPFFRRGHQMAGEEDRGRVGGTDRDSDKSGISLPSQPIYHV